MSKETKSLSEHLLENEEFLSNVFDQTLSGDVIALCYLHDLATASTERLNNLVSLLGDGQKKEFQDYCKTCDSWPVIHSPIPSVKEQDDELVRKLKVGIESPLNVTGRNWRDQTRQTNKAVRKLIKHIVRLRARRGISSPQRRIEVVASNLQHLSRENAEEWFFVIWLLMLEYTPKDPWDNTSFPMPQIGTSLSEIGQSAEDNSSGSEGEVHSKRLGLLWQAMWRAFVVSINPQVGDHFRERGEQVKGRKRYPRFEVRKAPSRRSLASYLRENSLARKE